ncbi:hypothetical protein CR513_57704, partial [Mucuna pruriens]
MLAAGAQLPVIDTDESSSGLVVERVSDSLLSYKTLHFENDEFLREVGFGSFELSGERIVVLLKRRERNSGN